METVKCPECPNTATVKDGDDLSDDAYKLSCPVLLDELARRGGTAPDIDCPHLGLLVRMTVLRLQHGHWRGPEPQQPLSSPPRGLMHENHSPAIAAELSVPERILLFCVASGTEWVQAGVTGATETAMVVRGLVDRDAAERLVLTPDGRMVLKALLGE
jgi:hypothetical protein